MALRLDSATEYLERLSVAVPYTVCGWSLLSVDRNDYSTVASADQNAVGSSSGNVFSLQTDADGITLGLYNGNAFVGSRTLTVGEWFFWAISNASNGTSFTWYHAAVGDAALYSASGTFFSSISNTRLHLGNNPYSEFFNGKFSGVRVWGAQITEAELLNEMRRLCPARMANLYLWTPMISATLADNAVDLSGSARDWTVGGTLAVEDGPPVPWGAQPVFIGKPVVTAQFARPTADASAGTWTASSGSDLYAMLDETAANDADYIVTTGASTCEVALSSLSDPASSSGHIVRYRISATGGGIIVRLRQETTTIATWTHDPAPSSLTTYAQTLSAGEADSITNYGSLSLQFEAV